MAAIAVDSPGACLIPPSFDGMTVQGPMTWEPYGFPRLPIDDMRHATGGGGSDEMSRVMCVLAGMERQLHSVLQGQAELRGLVAAASHRSPVQSPQTEQAVLPVAFPIDLGKESSPVGLDRLRSMSTESCQSGESTQPRKKHRYGAGSIWNSKMRRLSRTSSLNGSFGRGLTGSSSPAHRLSRSAFDSGRTQAEDKSELRSVFLHAESLETKEKQHMRLHVDRMRHLTVQELGLLSESLVCVLIIFNALFIGISMDTTEEYPVLILVLHIFFTAAFIMELTLKLIVNGFAGHFTGENYFASLPFLGC
eukprot:TRINITY_DN5513_c1_g1_i20.p1 TRINITY_DN5513_c1_g1~~TRINITY_DN5513_c1_g1_i20.p1  ORF type:complete len:307 (-),score=37.31 TRINITY_DN5513_c1_g1_i20:1805-2725(-)